MLLANIDDKDILADFIERIDGLLLAGGYDIDPAYYNEENIFPDSVIHSYRDKIEIQLVNLACKHRLPILAICRGHQLINVALGGSLYQDTSLRKNTLSHENNTGETLVHPVTINSKSRLAELADNLKTEVNSTHHQHIKTIADGFIVSAESDDKVIEAMENISDTQYILSVQWHPEAMPDNQLSNAIFEDFVKQAGKYGRIKE